MKKVKVPMSFVSPSGETLSAFDRALASAGIGTLEWDLQKGTVELSPSCSKVFGVDLGRHRLEDLEKHIHPSDLECFRTFATAATGQLKGAFETEFRVIDRSGTARWIRCCGAIERGEDNVPIRVSSIVENVTERKQSEVRLKQSEENFRELIKASALLVWIVDREGVSQDLLAWLSDLSGKKISDLRDIASIVHPDDHKAAHAAIKQAESSRTAFTIVCRFRSRSGDHRYLAIRGVPIFDPDRTLRQWIGTINDITERKAAEEIIQKSEALNKAVLDSMTSMVAVLDAKGNIKMLNRSWRQAIDGRDQKDRQFVADIGTNYPEHCKAAVTEFGHAAADVHSGIHQVLAGRQDLFSHEFRVEVEDAVRWFILKVTPLKTVEGGAVISHTDITDRKLAEERLRKNEAQLQFVADTVPTVIGYLDTNERFLFANRACLEWFGVSKNDLIGKRFVDVVGHPAYEQTHSEIQDALSGKNCSVERASKKHDGRYVHVEYIADRDRNGNVIGFFLFVVDLTQIRSAEERLLQSEEQLRQAQKLESIGRLAGGIAHDFNNMLTAINGYSELSLLRMAKDDPVRRNIEEIKKAGERSAALTQQLLAFSRRQIIEFEQLDVNKIVQDSLIMLQRLIGEDIKIITSLDPAAWSIRGDTGQLTQVIFNLVVNSRDAMPNGGTIEISSTNVVLDSKFAYRHPGSRSGSFVKLSVVDTGFGMDEETKKHIFEPFFTTKATGKGTGLGLSMVYGFVKQLQGYVWVQSGPTGTTFDVYLPKDVSGLPPGNEEQEMIPAGVGTETILLVEDEEIVQELSREVLESCGYRVIAVNNGKEALALLHDARLKIDLLLTDVVMPEIGGRQLVSELKRSRPDLKVLYASGYIDHETAGNGEEIDVSNFIKKPFSNNELARRVRMILDGD